MPKELLIHYHGPLKKADAGPASELSDQSKRDAQRFGVWMAQRNRLPDVTICAPTNAARTSACKSCKSAGRGDDSVRCDGRIDQSDPDTIATVVCEIPSEVTRALLVGRGRSLNRLLRMACRKNETNRDSVAAFVAGSLAVVTLDHDWGQFGSGDCVEVVVADDLPRKFPFPGPNGNPMRPRPAYYYRQSAVIPYRFRSGEIEVLVISTSKKKHWVVPKGIHDPGKSAQASAANEAREEAGILGEVHDAEIGVYHHTKWGGSCTVTVFPMKVTDELPERDWEENHRDRRWVSIDAAVELVRRDELKTLITKLPTVLAIGS